MSCGTSSRRAAPEQLQLPALQHRVQSFEVLRLAVRLVELKGNNVASERRTKNEPRLAVPSCHGRESVKHQTN